MYCMSIPEYIVVQLFLCLISLTFLGLQFLLLLQEFNLREQRLKDSLEQFWYSALDITASHGLNDKGKL